MQPAESENPYTSAALEYVPMAEEAEPGPQIPTRGILATRFGRLASFFLLYMTEGLPLGFTAVALATLMRKEGLGPKEIGIFVGTLYLPWSWKWIMGPIVDLVYSKRLGKRRVWIVGCQIGMAAALLVASGVDYTAQLRLFTAIILVHNMFGATMDVAIDALAVSTLKPDERGTANGLMFAGANIGNGIGGAGVLFLLPYMPVTTTFLLVAGAILAVTATVSLRLVEVKTEDAAHDPRGTFEIVTTYLKTVLLSCFGTRNGIVGMLVAILPAGALGLGLALQSNLAVELGMDDTNIGWLSLWSTIIAAIGCVLGGLLSDRLGRRRMLAIYILSMSIPTIWLATRLQAHGWIMPHAEGSPAVAAPDDLLNQFWIATLVYSLFQGLMYGSRSALFMDICKSTIAATQFTAFMSMMNLAIAYSAWWQGASAERWGYPTTLTIDAAVGLICLLPLALLNGSGSRTNAEPGS